MNTTTDLARCVPCITGNHAGCNRPRGALCDCALAGHDGTDPIKEERTTVTFYICPTDGGFWSPAGTALMGYDPADRINGGPRQCPTCSRSQADHDETRHDALAEARAEARYEALYAARDNTSKVTGP